ncbi:TIGR04206 family protein [Halobacteriales archaeon QS_4_69_225]|nr:MAG: TIGR04206 family protein [Halobacteriales archaeon QS_4_69_225]
MDDGSSPGRRLAAVASLGLLPWTVILLDGEASLVFGFGLVNTNPPTLVNIYDYLFVHTGRLPRRLQAWPAGTVLHAGALASAVGGLRSFEDPRLTGGLLVFAGLAHAQVAYGLHRAYGTSPAMVLPVGVLTTWAVAWWFYWPLVRERGLAV